MRHPLLVFALLLCTVRRTDAINDHRYQSRNCFLEAQVGEQRWHVSRQDCQTCQASRNVGRRSPASGLHSMWYISGCRNPAIGAYITWQILGCSNPVATAICSYRNPAGEKSLLHSLSICGGGAAGWMKGHSTPDLKEESTVEVRIQKFVESSKDALTSIQSFVKESAARSDERREQYKESLSVKTLLQPSRVGLLSLIAIVVVKCCNSWEL